MRFILLSASLLLPLLGQAQVFSHAEVGSYVLSTAPLVRQQAGLYLRSAEQLVVRNLAGETSTLSPQQVNSFRIGPRRYVATGGFRLSNGFGSTYVTQAFAEQLDSGQVVLLRYRSLPSNTAMRGNMGYGNERANSVYLLHPAAAFAVTPIQASWSKSSPQFRDALRPYLATRPDLLKLLDDKHLSPETLPLVVHALNNNLPFTPPSALHLN